MDSLTSFLNTLTQRKYRSTFDSDAAWRKRFADLRRLRDISDEGTRLAASSMIDLRRKCGSLRYLSAICIAAYRSYPANDSSPPSPFRATVTCCRVSFAT